MKSFKPKLDTIRVLSLGTKFIPKWEKTETTQMFKWFNDFKNKLNRKVYHFYESKPAVFEKSNPFYDKKNLLLTDTDKNRGAIRADRDDVVLECRRHSMPSLRIIKYRGKKRKI